MNERPLIEQRTLALAGVAQAARIVDLAAKTAVGRSHLLRLRFILFLVSSQRPSRQCLGLLKVYDWASSSYLRD